MDRLQKTTDCFALASGLSHLFCCGVPFVISILSLVANAGFLASLPSGLEYFHELMHGYEKGLFVFSAFILLLGWGLHFVAKRMDCHSTGCSHPPCDTKKTKSSWILIVATIIFVVNAASYFLFHS